jgi:hypothetical protein
MEEEGGRRGMEEDGGIRKRKEGGGRRKDEGGRGKEEKEGGRRKEEGGRRSFSQISTNLISFVSVAISSLNFLVNSLCSCSSLSYFSDKPFNTNELSSVIEAMSLASWDLASVSKTG